MGSSKIVFRCTYRGEGGTVETTSVTVRRLEEAVEFVFAFSPAIRRGPLQPAKQEEMKIQLKEQGDPLLPEGSVEFGAGRGESVLVRVDKSGVREVRGSSFLEINRASSLVRNRVVGEFKLLLPGSTPLHRRKLLTYEELLEELERRHPDTTTHMAVVIANVVVPIARSGH